MEYRKMTTARPDVMQIQCKKSLTIGILFFLFSIFSIFLLLFAKIYTLEKRINEVELQLAESSFSDSNPEDFQLNIEKKSEANELTQLNEDKNEGVERVKRSAKSGKGRRKIYGCHLVGDGGRTERDTLDEYFPLTKDFGRTAACQMKVALAPNGLNVRAIRITESGYYFVYAQVTIQGLAYQIFGFKTVVRDRRNRDRTLMSTVKTLRDGDVDRSKESGYHGGLFYLKEGQELVLKRTEPIIDLQDYDFDRTRMYFGAIFMQKYSFN